MTDRATPPRLPSPPRRPITPGAEIRALDLPGATWSEIFQRRIDANETAVILDDEVWTARDLMARAAGYADWFDEIGATRGTPLPALVTTRAETFALTLGGLGSRRPLAPLGPRLTTRELAACVRGLAAPILLAEPEFADHAAVVAADTGMRVEVVPELRVSTRRLELDHGIDEVAAILHTSGTSGIPKPVPYRMGPLAHRTRVNGAFMGFVPGDSYLSTSPFHHIAGLGLLFVALGCGAALFPFPRFSIDAWSAVLDRGVTHAVLVPTMVSQLLDEGRLVPGQLRLLHYGASPIHPVTLRRLLDALPNVKLGQIYGQTEGSPITFLLPPDHVLAAQGRDELLASAGRAAPGVEMIIHEPDEHGIGEVWARAPHFFKMSDDGWLHSGDLGRVDDEGYLYLVGRKGDMIVRGGENVYPEEVEHVLAEHPAVREVGVVGIPDERWGEIVRAAIVWRDPTNTPSIEELRAHARSQLAGFKVPTDWRFVEELPLNATGKLLRRALRSDD